MTRAEALNLARERHSARLALDIAALFGRGLTLSPEEEWSRFGYARGWYVVGDFAFNSADVTGLPYDPTQGGWSHL